VTSAAAPGTLTVGPVEAAQVERYALAARDHNPVHLDAAFARRIGLEGPIVHGMFVMGQFERLVRRWRTDQAVENLSLRFTKPVPIGSTLTLQARLAQATPLEDGRIRTLLRVVATVDRAVVAIGTVGLLGSGFDLT
jgi:acyl dehydratase